jgi:hypothetical protein
MKKARNAPRNKPDRRDGLKRAAIEKGPAWRPDSHLLVQMIPDFDNTPEWRAAAAAPQYSMWRDSPWDEERVRGAVAANIIAKLRHPNVRKRIVIGDPFWLALTINVVCSHHRWHQSGRIQLSAMRSLRQRLTIDTLSAPERSRLLDVMNDALLRNVDVGAGQEFRALARVARTVTNNKLIAGLEDRVSTSKTRSVRINAQRMLDYINGKPYSKYHHSFSADA